MEGVTPGSDIKAPVARTHLDIPPEGETAVHGLNASNSQVVTCNEVKDIPNGSAEVTIAGGRRLVEDMIWVTQ